MRARGRAKLTSMARDVAGRNLGQPLHVGFERADLEVEIGTRRFVEPLEQARVGTRMVGAVHHQNRGAGGESALARCNFARPGNHRVNRLARKVRAVGISERQVGSENLGAVERLPYKTVAPDLAADTAPYDRGLEAEAGQNLRHLRDMA